MMSFLHEENAATNWLKELLKLEIDEATQFAFNPPSGLSKQQIPELAGCVNSVIEEMLR